MRIDLIILLAQSQKVHFFFYENHLVLFLQVFQILLVALVVLLDEDNKDLLLQ
jgi:hypothetical protein